MTDGERVSLFLLRLDEAYTIINVIADNIENTGSYLWHIIAPESIVDTLGGVAIEIIKGPASGVNTVKDDETNYSDIFELVQSRATTSLTSTKTSTTPQTVYHTQTDSSIASSTASPTGIPSTALVSDPVSIRFIVGITVGGFGLAMLMIAFVFCFSMWKRRCGGRRRQHRVE